MPEPEPSPTGNEPIAEPARPRTIKCEACESILHPSGDVKKKSDALKELERARDEAASWKSKYETAQAKLDELLTQPHPEPEPGPQPEPKRKRHLIEA